jgi:hypothetical protein
MYTDDPVIAVVGVERTVRLLMCWVRTMKELNLRMALACKRQLGTGVVWCGVSVFSHGALVIPLDKRLRALHALRRLGKGTLPVGELQPLTGLLEFCRGVLRLKSDTMYGLYGPLRGTGEISRGPGTLVKQNTLLQLRVKEWSQRMLHACSNTVTAVMKGHRSIPTSAALLVTSSDACKEGAHLPGMGGFLAGLWWRYVYEADHLRLDIPVLELLAFAVNLIVFEPVLCDMLSNEDILVCLIDAKASPLILSDGRSKSPIMQYALQLIRELPAYTRLETQLAVAHVYGEGNKPADFASRSNIQSLQSYASQCGVQLSEKPQPNEAKNLLDKVLAFQDSIQVV